MLSGQRHASARIDFSGIFEAVLVPFVILDPFDYRVLAVNDCYLRTFGLARENIAGKRLHVVLSALVENDGQNEQVGIMHESLLRVRETRRPDALRMWPYTCRDQRQGELRRKFWNVTNSPVLDESGRLSCIVHHVEDVTELLSARRERGEAFEHRRLLSVRAEQVESENAQYALEIRRLQEQLGVVQRLDNAGTWYMNMVDGEPRWSAELFRLLGLDPAAHKPSAAVLLNHVHPDDRDVYLAGRARLLAAEQLPGEIFYRIVRAETVDVREVHERVEALRNDDGEVEWLLGTVQDITEQRRAEQQLRVRARQQAAIAELGQRALQETNLGKLHDVTVSCVAGMLDVEFCEVMKLEPTQGVARLIAGVGWREGHVGEATVDLGRESQAGYTLLSDEPVLVEDLRNDDRFRGSWLLEEHGVVSGLSVIIHGERGPWGVLGVHDSRQRTFGEDDVAFVRSVANIIGEANRRNDTERLHRQSEERTTRIVENALDAVIAIDTESRILEWNVKAEETFGWTKSEVIGEHLHELIIPLQYRERHVAGMKKFLESGEGPLLGRRVEVSALHRDGREFPVELSITVIRTDDGLHFSAFLRDISSRKRREDRLREQAALLDKASDAIIVRDLDHRVRYWNRSAERIYGWQADEAIGERIDELLHLDKALFSDAVQVLMDCGEWVGEISQRRKDGGIVDCEVSWTLVNDEQDRPVAIMSINTEITERLALEDRLRQSQRLEAIGQLTGGVAHDFNNLLTVILGNAELMADRLPQGDPLCRLAEMTRDAAARGAELTHGLLAFSRRQALEPKAVDVNRLLKDMRNLLRQAVPESINIKLELKDDLWSAFVDPAQLESVVLNLVLNAKDAMQGSGRLTIETNCVSFDDDYAARHAETIPGDYVLLAVSDTGCGIPSDVIDKVFDPYFTTKEEGKGTGLGLSMAYGFAKQSSGHINIYSEPGSGTAVKLYLPRTEQVQKGVEAVPELEYGNGEKILVVEDEELVRVHVESQLEAFGYQVIAAASGPEALEVLERESGIDLLFTDVIMSGGMNGPELVQRARQIIPTLKVLYTSGYTENAIVHHGRLDEGVQLLQKPYRLHELASKVAKALTQSE